MKVKWLSGIEDIIYNVSANKVLTIEEGGTLSSNIYNDDISFWPNPTQDILHVETKYSYGLLQIIDINGSFIVKKHRQ